MEKITVVVPIYNVEAYLERCLSSIQNQSFKDFKVLCINDGSTDGSKEKILPFLKDSRFILFDKANGGLSDARNYGLRKVDTEYVCFIDSDDFLEKQYLERMIKRLEKDQADLVVCDYYQYFDEKNLKESIALPYLEDQVYSLDKNHDLLAYLNNAAWNKVYRTQVFMENGLEYPFGYRHQDLGLTFRYLYYAKKVVFVNEALYDYLADRPNNLTQMIDPKIDHILDMIQINADFFTEKKQFKHYENELTYLAGINLLNSLKKLPKFKDQKFVLSFIDQAFDQMEKTFPKFPKTSYPLMKEAHAWLYLNRNLLKWYYRYKRFRKGL
jgi:glycosyltransferase involved in cell wall biosynthesis